MARKKDNTLLYLAAGGGAALFYFNSQTQELKIGGQTVSSIFKRYGIVDGIDYIIDHVELWPEVPARHADGSFISEYKQYQLVAEKAVEFSARSRVLFKKIAEKLGKLDYWPGTGSSGTWMKNTLLGLEKQEYAKEAELANYIAAKPGIQRLKTSIKQLLKQAQTNHEFINSYKDSWASSLIAVVETIGEALDDIWKAVKGFGRLALNFIKYAPYILVGLGGMWAYNNFVKEG